MTASATSLLAASTVTMESTTTTAQLPARRLLRIVDRLPRMDSKTSTGVVASHPVVSRVQPCTGIDQQLDHRSTPFVAGAVQSRASGFGLDVGVDSEIQQELHGFEVGFFRPFVG